MAFATNSYIQMSTLPARIKQLWIYPIKSCAGIALDECVLTDTGLDLDRAWMVVDEQGKFVTQRQLPRMALIQPSFKGSDMVLRAPGMLALHVSIDAVEQSTQVEVWKDHVPAYDMGNVAAQWFSDFLSLDAQGLPVAGAKRYRLVRFDPDCQRLANREWTGDIEAFNQFSDGFPLLVLNQASVDALNHKLVAAGHAPVGAERFRPNILIEGFSAHDEDHVLQLQISEANTSVVLGLVKPCTRCAIPNIDPANALSHPAVVDTLRSYRKDDRVQGGITFGMNAIVLSGVDQVLRVGQTVT